MIVNIFLHFYRLHLYDRIVRYPLSARFKNSIGIVTDIVWLT